MLTWLDYYVTGARQSVPGASNMTDRAAMARLCRGLLTAVRGGLVQPTDLPTGQTLAVLAAAVWPFVAADEADRATVARMWMPPHGIQPTAEVVADLAEAHPPAAGVAEAVAELRRACWYVDLPHRSLMIDARQQVRALFTITRADGRDSTTVLAIITLAGSDRVNGRVTWEMTPAGEPVPGTLVVDAPSPLDQEAVQRAVWDFLLMIMLYRLTTVDQATEQQELPRGEERPGLTGKSATRERARRKQISLFRIVRLLPRPGRLGRHASGQQRASWRLDHLVAVRGFFRLQPHGPGSALRRLIWIDPHTRGPQSAPRTDLDRL